MAKKTAKLSTITISATALRKLEYESTLGWNQRSTAKGKVNCNSTALKIRILNSKNFSAQDNDDGLKGQRAKSPRQRLGCQKSVPIALQGQKHFKNNKAYALSGRLYTVILTQGDAQGFYLTGLSGRIQNTGSKLGHRVALIEV